MSSFRLYTNEFHAFMSSEQIGAELRRRGELVREAAIATAPVAKKGKHRGRYKASFPPVTTAIGRADRTPWGPRGRRVYAIVSNTSPEARAVEFGAGSTPRYRTLGRALSAAGDRPRKGYK